jgi:hypothetical protein
MAVVPRSIERALLLLESHGLAPEHRAHYQRLAGEDGASERGRGTW